MLPEVWSFLEVTNGNLHDTAYKMAAESQRLADIFGVDAGGVICGLDSSEALEHLKWYGLKTLYLLQGGPMLSPETITHAIISASLRYNPHFILFADTPTGAEIAARVAASLGRGMVSCCVDFESDGGKPLGRKAVYNGKAHAVFAWKSPPPYIATIDLAALEDVKTESETRPDIVREDVEETVSTTRLLRKWKIELSGLSLTEASVVVGVGKGVEKQFMEAINRLAGDINGVVGGSRIAVYSGLIPLENQVGTTGKWLSSDVYIAIGISGAPQHVMGIKEVKNIIAINKTKDAPIFRYTKLGIVGDLYEVVPKLIDLVEADTKGKS